MASTAPITALIIDDEQLAREELKYLLDTAGSVEVLAQGSNGVEAVELIREYQPDVVFLDVQMPGLDGFAVLKQLIEHRDLIPQIVFATAFDQYAVRAFDVNAIDYLLKPFDRNRVLQALDRVRLRLQEMNGSEAEPAKPAGDLNIDTLLRLIEQQQASPRPHSGKIVLQAQSRLLLVDQKDICFASIDEGVISVVTPTLEGQSKCRTLEELLELLDPNLFWRAHRSFVVNINHIKEVVPWFKSSYQLRMDDRKQTEIPVSRAQTRRLRELFKL
ncbi:LytR/AlgR family response regulator transcription factor [Silvibacterium dinghuense]|uniref:Response regulator n=1 Tax=Silvibacterium dinghuense TaxID=1560006 RepID=A0A4Q1S976_9BACT|nr:response regulator [Silvibacterium dinghuense]RXS93439.1 response regulator [Silvibacterium dinghuense]GGH05791.1 DNA-binding response regulator [Silvibacterium dinghuense]